MQFTLRSVMIVITLCAVTLGLWQFMATGPLIRLGSQMLLVIIYAGTIGCVFGPPMQKILGRFPPVRILVYSLIGFSLLLSAYAFWAYYRWTWVNLGDLHWPRPLPYPDSLTLAVYEWLVSSGTSRPGITGFGPEFHTVERLVAVVQFATLAAGAVGCGMLLPHPRKANAAKGNVA